MSDYKPTTAVDRNTWMLSSIVDPNETRLLRCRLIAQVDSLESRVRELEDSAKRSEERWERHRQSLLICCEGEPDLERHVLAEDILGALMVSFSKLAGVPLGSKNMIGVVKHMASRIAEATELLRQVADPKNYSWFADANDDPVLALHRNLQSAAAAFLAREQSND